MHLRTLNSTREYSVSDAAQDIVVDIVVNDSVREVIQLEEWAATEAGSPARPSVAVSAWLAPTLPNEPIVFADQPLLLLLVDCSRSIGTARPSVALAPPRRSCSPRHRARDRHRTAGGHQVLAGLVRNKQPSPLPPWGRRGRSRECRLGMRGSTQPSAIWLGTFGLRVNAQRFALKDDTTDAEAFLTANVVNADGGSPLLPALASALLQLTQADVHAQLLLVSDGRLADYHEAVEALQVAGIRTHALGVGYSPDQTTLRRIAEATNGVADVVFPGDAQLQLQTVVDRMARRMMRMPLQPAAQGEWASADTNKPSMAAKAILMSPSSWPGALDGSPVLLFSILGPSPALVTASEPGALLDEVRSANILLSSGGMSRVYRTADYVSVNATRLGRMLHQCAARRGIEELERVEGTLQHDLTVAKAARSELVVNALQSKLNATKQQIIALGVQYSLASTHTSFLIVVKDSAPSSAPSALPPSGPSMPSASAVPMRSAVSTMMDKHSLSAARGGAMYTSGADCPLAGSPLLVCLSAALLSAVLR